MASGVKKLVLVMLLVLGGIAAAQSTEQPRKQRQHEILRERPSGFWTSNRPAQGGAYRWRLLGLGIAIAAGMGFVIVRTLRRAESNRANRRA